MTTTVNISYCAGDYVWVIVDPDDASRSLQKGLVRLVTTEATGSTPEITYHIRLPGDAGTTKFLETEPPANIFAVLDKVGAIARYSVLLD